MLFLLFFIPLLLPHWTLASVLAIDYGTDWIKASLMKPGVPFDVLLNKDSKRKIQSSVAFKGSDRLFGTDAFNLASRFPQDSFSSIKYVLTHAHNSETASYYNTVSTATTLSSARKTVAFRRPDGTQWTAVELVAMQLAYVRELAEAVAGERVTDVVLAVPPYYAQAERDALTDAAEIAGLRTLALVNDGTAVAMNYAMTRAFAAPEVHVVFDVGASALRATVVRFEGAAVRVLGVGHDRAVGGTELDRRLRELLIGEFEAKHKRDVRGDSKAMAKLWKESGRLKAILSANTEAISTIESLAFDIDFRVKVTRRMFEDVCADLKPKFTQPIMDALRNAGVTLDQVNSVILTGGSSRTPMIQAALKAAVGENKIAQNVNADEAVVLGAAFYGATLSPQFRTKDIRVTDIIIHDLQASYFAAPSAADARPRTISTLIFPAGSKVDTKKTLTFKRKEDFSVWLDHRMPPAPGFPTSILEVEIKGVAEALANLTQRGAVDPVIKANVSLSKSSFVSVQEAVAFGEVKDETLAGKLKGFFKGNAAPKKGGDDDEAEEGQQQQQQQQQQHVLETDAEEPAVSARKVDGTILLETNVKFGGLSPMTVEEKRAARDRLREIDREESLKRRREEARNALEAYMYRMRDLLEDTNQETPFKKCSQPEERKAITDRLAETMTWLHERGDLAETSQFYDKRNSIEALERPVVHRYKEIEAFPQALNNSQMWNWSTRLFLTEARQNLTEEEQAGRPSKWTRDELMGLEKALREHERWLSEWVEKQKAVGMNEDPVIETTEMKARAKTLENHLQRLVRRKIPKARKPSGGEGKGAASGEGESGPRSSAAADADPPKETVPLRPHDDEL